MRLAIGAGRARLVRQLITESLLTALLGGLAGLGLGYAGITLFRQIELPSDLPIQLTLQMDQRALWFGPCRFAGERVVQRRAARDSGQPRGPDGGDEGRRRGDDRPSAASGDVRCLWVGRSRSRSCC